MLIDSCALVVQHVAINGYSELNEVSVKLEINF